MLLSEPLLLAASLDAWCIGIEQCNKFILERPACSSLDLPASILVSYVRKDSSTTQPLHIGFGNLAEEMRKKLAAIWRSYDLLPIWLEQRKCIML